MVQRERDCYWSFIEPVRVRLENMTEGEREVFLHEVACEAIHYLEEYFESHNDGNNNFRRTLSSKFSRLLMDDPTHQRLLDIVNAIGPRAWEDVVHHVIMRRLGL